MKQKKDQDPNHLKKNHSSENASDIAEQAQMKSEQAASKVSDTSTDQTIDPSRGLSPSSAAPKTPQETPESSVCENPSETSLKTQCEALELQVKEHFDKYLRVVAEMENLKKRFDRDKAEYTKFCLEAIMRDLLEVMDCFNLAIPEEVTPNSGENISNSFHEGMKMVKKRLFDVLSKHGLQPIEAINKEFDPNLHQAIQRIETAEINTDLVKEEFSRGYLLNGRLLRPSIVSVATPKE